MDYYKKLGDGFVKVDSSYTGEVYKKLGDGFVKTARNEESIKQEVKKPETYMGLYGPITEVPKYTNREAAAQWLPRTMKTDELGGGIGRQALSGVLDVTSLPFRLLATGIGNVASGLGGYEDYSKLGDIGGESATTEGMAGTWQRFSEGALRSPLNAIPFGALGNIGAKLGGVGAEVLPALGRGLAMGTAGAAGSAAEQYATTGEVKAAPTVIAGAIPLALGGFGGYAGQQATEDIARGLRVPEGQMPLIDKYARMGVLEGRKATEISEKLGKYLDKFAETSKETSFATKVLEGDAKTEFATKLRNAILDDADANFSLGKITKDQMQAALQKADVVYNEVSALPTKATQLSRAYDLLQQPELSGIDRLFATKFSGYEPLTTAMGGLSSMESAKVAGLYDLLKGGAAEAGGFVRPREIPVTLSARRQLADLAAGVQPYTGIIPQYVTPAVSTLAQLAPSIAYNQYVDTSNEPYMK